MLAPEAAVKPPVLRCVVEGFLFVCRFARARPGMFLYLLGVSLAERLLEQQEASPLFLLFFGSLVMALQAPPLVALHRAILLGEGRVPMLPSRVLRYAGFSLMLLLIVTVPASLGQLAVVSGAGSSAATIAGLVAVGALVVSVRASLALPHAAIDGERPVRASLDLVRGSAWRVFAATMLPMLLLLIPLGLDAALPEGAGGIVELVGALASAWSVAAAAAALTYAYRVLAQAAGAPL